MNPFTGGESKGVHVYVDIDAPVSKIILEENSQHIADVQAKGQQVVIAGSVHPVTENKYKVLIDKPIAKISKEVYDYFKNKYTKHKEFEVKAPNWNQFNFFKSGSQIDITSLLDMSKLKKHGQEYYGSNPWHGSETGQNFWVNPKKNLAYCFRCQSGLDSLAVLAINKGICNCDDFSIGGKKLRGDDFKKVVEIAKQEYNFNLSLDISDSQFKISVISAKELSEMNIPAPSWIVEGWIPEESLVILAGKTGAMKSFLTTVMGMCSVYEKKFLDKFATKKSVWLYFDQDNPLIMTKDRNKKILTGLNIDAPDEFKYICQNGVKLDNEEHMNILEETINFYKPSVVVLDSLGKFLLKADENSSLDISNIFSNLRILSMKYRTSFLIIHHLRKSAKGSKDEDNDEKVRGSTDIVNSADCLLMVSRKEKTSPYIQVRQEKNRYGKEIEPFTIFLKQNPKTNAIIFEIAPNSALEQDIESKAANQILSWLTTERTWSPPADKIFKTAEVIERFESVFNTNTERNRKIIQGALSKLVVMERIQRSAKGYYKFVDLVNLEDDK